MHKTFRTKITSTHILLARNNKDFIPGTESAIYGFLFSLGFCCGDDNVLIKTFKENVVLDSLRWAGRKQPTAFDKQKITLLWSERARKQMASFAFSLCAPLVRTGTNITSLSFLIIHGNWEPCLRGITLVVNTTTITTCGKETLNCTHTHKTIIIF